MVLDVAYGAFLLLFLNQKCANAKKQATMRLKNQNKPISVSQTLGFSNSFVLYIVMQQKHWWA